MSETPYRKVGLKAVDEARDARGRKTDRRLTAPIVLLGGSALVFTILVAWLVTGRSLANAKVDLLSQQRAAVKTVGAEWYPLRDRVEKLTVDAASAPFGGDAVDPAVGKWDFRSVPGIYLRLRVADAKDIAALRKRASESGKDGFTACLLRGNSPRVAAIARGEDGGTDAQQDQPWNLRQAYAATRVLTDEWAHEAQEAGDELHLRVFVQQYEKAKSVEIPWAIDIVKRAQFFLLVLDEDVPEAKALAGDGGVTEETLQLVAHPSRVYLFDLKTGAPLVRLRRSGEGSYYFAQGQLPLDPEARDALKRQVNNCDLAQSVWTAVRPPNAKDAGP